MAHDDFEARFWGDCCLTLGEELKQLVYLREMGFVRDPNNWRTAYSFDAKGARVIDIGGGPVSVLLKFENLYLPTVVDPAAASWPVWVHARYAAKGIGIHAKRGEDIATASAYDLALVYNCLQHVDDPERIVANAQQAKALKLFEWVDIPAHEGHPHQLSEAALNRWAGRAGRIVEFSGENECYGRAYILQ